MAKPKRKPLKPAPEPVWYCPWCRRCDKLRDDLDIPQLTQCTRCKIQFFIEDIDEDEPDDPSSVTVEEYAPPPGPLAYGTDPEFIVQFGAITELANV